MQIYFWIYSVFGNRNRWWMGLEGEGEFWKKDEILPMSVEKFEERCRQKKEKKEFKVN